MARPLRDPSNSDATLKRDDIKGWRKALDAWEAEGLIDTAPVILP